MEELITKRAHVFLGSCKSQQFFTPEVSHDFLTHEPRTEFDAHSFSLVLSSFTKGFQGSAHSVLLPKGAAASCFTAAPVSSHCLIWLWSTHAHQHGKTEAQALESTLDAQVEKRVVVEGGV